MSFFVLMYRETQPEHLEEVLSQIRERLGTAPAVQGGRRSSRVFQRIGEPTHLLTVAEWDDEAGFLEFSRSPSLTNTDTLAGSPASIMPLIPLIRFEHMTRRASIASCVTMTATPEHTPALRAFLAGPAHDETRRLPGIVSREVYRARDKPGTFLVVHSWVSLSDLDRFRTTSALQMDRIHDHHQTTITAFTGALAAEFPPFAPASS